MREKDPKQAAVLLQAAERDLEATRRMLDPGFHDMVFGQIVQQAAEKLLKAWICLLGQQYPHTHDLKKLMALLAAQGVPMEDFAALHRYTRYARELRYLIEDTPALERPEAIRLAERLRARMHDAWRECMGTPAPLAAGDHPL